MRVLSLSQVGSKQGGGGSTLQSNEDAELKKLTHQCVIDREEERLNLLERIYAFESSFSRWGTREWNRHGDRIRAGMEAGAIIEAVLQDDKQAMIKHLDQLAFELGYRIKAGRFDDSPTPEEIAERKQIVIGMMEKCGIQIEQ
jgi:hypothetical protein